MRGGGDRPNKTEGRADRWNGERRCQVEKERKGEREIQSILQSEVRTTDYLMENGYGRGIQMIKGELQLARKKNWRMMKMLAWGPALRESLKTNILKQHDQQPSYRYTDLVCEFARDIFCNSYMCKKNELHDIVISIIMLFNTTDITKITNINMFTHLSG